MQRLALRLLTAAVLLYFAAAAIIYATQRRQLFGPGTTRPNPAVAALPTLQVVDVPTEDGLRLLAWWVPPPQRDRPVLAYFHGNGGNLENRASRLRRFAAEGWGVLMLEYRGYGGNPGTPSEAGFAADARAAMAFLDRQGIPDARRAVYGESIGTGVAVHLAAGRPVAALVLESPYTSITDLARRRFPWLPVRLLLRDRFDSLAQIARVRAPLLVLQGGRDGIVPPELGQALFQAALEPKRMWAVPAAGHDNLMDYGAADVVAGFLKQWMPGGMSALQ